MSMLNSNIDNEIEILLSGDLDNLLRDQDIFSESSFQKILDPWTKKDFKPVLCARSKANSIIFGIAFVNPFLYDTWLVVPLNITDAVEIWFDVVLRIATQASDKQVKYLLGCWAKHYPVSSNWFNGLNFIGVKEDEEYGYYRCGVIDVLRMSQSTEIPSILLDRYLKSEPRTGVLQVLCPTRQRLKDGAVQILVPSGFLDRGISRRDAEIIRDSMGLYPENEVDRGCTEINSFWMDKYCITNSQYASFLNFLGTQERQEILELGSRQPGFRFNLDDDLICPYPSTNNLPVIVPVELAQLYANWVHGRLPTEDEWEWAARGPDGRWFPWGNSNPDFRKIWHDCTQAGSVAANPEGDSCFGISSMVGNVWQWCATTYNSHPQYRGGDYKLWAIYWKRTTVRPLDFAEECQNQVGFRLVFDK